MTNIKYLSDHKIKLTDINASNSIFMNLNETCFLSEELDPS